MIWARADTVFQAAAVIATVAVMNSDTIRSVHSWISIPSSTILILKKVGIIYRSNICQDMQAVEVRADCLPTKQGVPRNQLAFKMVREILVKKNFNGINQSTKRFM
jgi:hypothetical protein